MKVSMVSVSRLAGPPHFGQVVLTNFSLYFKRRFAGRFELGVLRQQHRQVFFRYGDDAAFFTVNDGDGCAPVALAGNEPVTQLVAYGALCPSLFRSR